MRVEKAGVVPLGGDERRSFAAPDPFDVATGARVTRDLPMRSGAAREGRMWRATGEPTVNVVVSAMRMGIRISCRPYGWWPRAPRSSTARRQTCD